MSHHNLLESWLAQERDVLARMSGGPGAGEAAARRSGGGGRESGDGGSGCGGGVGAHACWFRSCVCADNDRMRQVAASVTALAMTSSSALRARRAVGLAAP